MAEPQQAEQPERETGDYVPWHDVGSELGNLKARVEMMDRPTNNPDAAPTYEQIRRLGQWADEIIRRISNELASVQQAGPTRISGMRKELDRAAQAAVREWAKELKGADYEIRHGPAGQGLGGE